MLQLKIEKNTQIFTPNFRLESDTFSHINNNANKPPPMESFFVTF